MTVFLAASCYEDYIKDYDYSTVYCAFQYDLRTFVVGEGEKFDFTVGLAGVMNNNENRKVNVTVDDNLVTGSIPAVLGIDEKAFTAYDGMVGKAGFGSLAQSYVTDEVKALGTTALTPLPTSHYSISGLEDLTIKAGDHTATATITATEDFLSDPKGIAPWYAIGLRIESAAADTLFAKQCYEIIAVKYENKYYGNWYYGGKTVVMNDATGEIISTDEYPFAIPQKDDQIYTLKTIAPDAVVTNKIGNKAGQLTLTFDGDDIKLSCDDPAKKIVSGSCFANGAKKLQDRVISLDYSFSNGDGTTSFVKDELRFRNRIRDGVSEWRDENPENYK